MTIKWVKVDPLVMNGEPFCYGTRLTVRQVLELRRSGYDLTRLLADHPELRLMGVASIYRYAADHLDRYGEFFGQDGSLLGPGLTDDEARDLPQGLRIAGVTVARDSAVAGSPDAAPRTIPNPAWAVDRGSPAAVAAAASTQTASSAIGPKGDKRGKGDGATKGDKGGKRHGHKGRGHKG